MIRLLLVDDHDTFRIALSFVLENEPDLSVVVQAGSVTEARKALQDLRGPVDLAVVDLDLPDGSGTEVVDELHRRKSGTRTLVLTSLRQPGTLARAIEAGASGVYNKASPLEEIVGAIRRLHAGEQILSQAEIIEAIRLVSRERRQESEAQRLISKLTPREREVLQALAEGLGDREISERLFVGIGTVRTHMASILAKLEVNSRLQALVFAARHGIVKID